MLKMTTLDRYFSLNSPLLVHPHTYINSFKFFLERKMKTDSPEISWFLIRKTLMNDLGLVLKNE
jgi:hypothetical protein